MRGQRRRHAARARADDQRVDFPVPFDAVHPAYAPDPPSDLPPSTKMTWPVMKSMCGAARKDTALATSPGWPARPVGCRDSCAARRSGVRLRSSGVSMSPGATALTRMRRAGQFHGRWRAYSPPARPSRRHGMAARPDRRARSDVHDLGAGGHAERGFLRQRRHRQQVDLEGAAVIVAVDVEELAFVEDAGVVDQRAERRELADQRARSALVRQVDHAVRDVQPLFAEPARFAFREFREAVRHYDAKAVEREAHDDRQPHAARPARNQCRAQLHALSLYGQVAAVRQSTTPLT